MALPSLDNPADKGQVQEIVADIATAVFKSAKISLETAAKAVVPSVPEMVDEVLEDLKSGSILKFNQAMDKLDKLVNKLGIDLKDYNKELANFAARREEKIIKSEEKIQTLKEKNVIAEIEKSGDIKILSNREIEVKKDNLDKLEKQIKGLEKSIEKDRKLVQESDKLKTTAQFKAKEDLKENAILLDQKKKERDKEKEVLGERGEQQPGIFQRAREGTGNFVDEYVPDQITEIGSAIKEGFMAPFTAIQELGRGFGQLLKPLKLLKPLFGGLIKGIKRFALGLKGAVAGFLPFIAIFALVVVGIYALYKAFEDVKNFFDRFRKERENEYDMGPQETDMPDDTPVAAEGDMSSRVQRRSFVFGEAPNAQVITPDNPDYDKLYMEQFGKEAPKPGQVYMGDGKVAILPLSSDNRVNPNEMRNKPPVLFDNPLVDLQPAETKEKGGSAQVNNVSQSSVTNNQSFASSGLGDPHNKDYESFLYRDSVTS